MPKVDAIEFRGLRPTAEDLDALTSLKLNGLTLVDAGLTDQSTAVVAKNSGVRHLSLAANPAIGDASMGVLAEMLDLVGLDLRRSKITNEGLAKLHRLNKLTYLVLSGTSITGAASQTIRQFPDLQSLEIMETKMDDAGLSDLRSLTKLEYLAISACPEITDKGLESLAELKSLRELRAQHLLKVTSATVQKLQASLPNCRIISDSPPAANPR